MFKFVFQFLIVLILLLRNRRIKGGWFTPSGVLIMIYAICSFMGIIVVATGEYRTPIDFYYWLPMLEFDIFIILYLFYFHRFNESKVDFLHLPNKRFMDAFSTVIIILSFFSIFYYSSTVVRIFMMGDLGGAREIRYVEGEFIESGLLNTIASVSAANYVFAIVLFFIYRIIGGSKIRCLLLLISSMSNPIHVLAFVGRDGVVFWLFTFIFCYAFFKPFMYDQQKKDIRKTLIIVGAVLLTPFLLITISRFGQSVSMATGGTTGSIISYLGQSFVQGPLFFGIENKPVNPGASFPLFRGLFGIPDMERGIVDVGEWCSWKFSTFIVTLYISLGLFGLIVFTFFMILLFSAVLGFNRSRINLGQFALYILYFQIISEGVFYFCHYTRGGNLFIITTLILSIVFSMSSRGGLVLKKVK